MDLDDNDLHDFLDSLSTPPKPTRSSRVAKRRKPEPKKEIVPETDDDDDDEDFLDGDDDDDDDEIEEDAEEEIMERGTVVKAPAKFTIDLPANLVPVSALEEIIITAPMMRSISWFMQPGNYEKCREIINGTFQSPISRPSFGPFGDGSYFVSLDILWELTRYFQGCVNGPKRDMELAMCKIGKLVDGRVIPSVFALGFMGQAATFIVPGEIMKYLGAKFVPLSDAEIRAVPKKQRFGGSRSFLNFGKCYDADRPFPDCREKSIVANLIGRGHVFDRKTGFVVFGIDNVDLFKFIGKTAADKLKTSCDRAAELNKIGICAYREPVLPKEKIPTSIDELAVCVVFDVNTKMLVLYPGFEEHPKKFIRFDRDRPKTAFPYVTKKVSI